MARTVFSDMLKIFKASYTAVLPDKIIRQCVSYDPKSEVLNITSNGFDLTNKDVYVVGAGKAVQYMAREIDVILGNKIKKGIFSIPANSSILNTEKVSCSNIVYYEGAQNNLPDCAAEVTAKKIKELAMSLTANDFLLVLISGGGSALLPLPIEPITLDEKLGLVKKLANSGADIVELNIVRKKISAIKGGKLAIAANPAITVAIILSDIVDDPLDLIASGPTVQDTDDVEKAINIIKKYKLYEDLPKSIREVLEKKTLPKVNLAEVPNFLLGSNEKSILAAYDEAKHNYTPIILSRSVTGNVRELAKEYVKLAKAFADYIIGKNDQDCLKRHIIAISIPGIKPDFIDNLEVIDKGFCLILGGEPTVEVKGTGQGGRNQQLALEFSKYIHEAKDDFKGCNVYMLSAGTDGIDGPTNAAGAIGYLDLISDSKKDNINVHEFIENNDSYNFYKSFKAGIMHVITGHTNTNVMDTHLIIIQRCQ